MKMIRKTVPQKKREKEGEKGIKRENEKKVARKLHKRKTLNYLVN